MNAKIKKIIEHLEGVYLGGDVYVTTYMGGKAEARFYRAEDLYKKSIEDKKRKQTEKS